MNRNDQRILGVAKTTVYNKAKELPERKEQLENNSVNK